MTPSIITMDKTLPIGLKSWNWWEGRQNINKWIAKADDSHHLLSLFLLSFCQEPFEKTGNHADALHHMLSLLSICDALSYAQWHYFGFALPYGNTQGKGRGRKGFQEPTKILRMRTGWDVKFHFLGGQMRKKIIIH